MRALEPEPRRPRQPPPGRLDAAATGCSSASASTSPPSAEIAREALARLARRPRQAARDRARAAPAPGPAGRLRRGASTCRSASSGPQARHVIAFARRNGETWVIAIVPRLPVGLVAVGVAPIGPHVWGDTAIRLPDGAPREFRNALTGEHLAVLGRIARARGRARDATARPGGLRGSGGRGPRRPVARSGEVHLDDVAHDERVEAGLERRRERGVRQLVVQPGEAERVDHDVAGEHRRDGRRERPIPPALGEHADEGRGDEHADQVAARRARDLVPARRAAREDREARRSRPRGRARSSRSPRVAP